jgi:hypothetical protein
MQDRHAVSTLRFDVDLVTDPPCSKVILRVTGQGDSSCSQGQVNGSALRQLPTQRRIAGELAGRAEDLEISTCASGRACWSRSPSHRAVFPSP